jgi:hypothetical protein
MAKRKVNKSEEIRQVLASGIESPTEVAATLAAKGIKVSPSAVSVIKGKWKKTRTTAAAPTKAKAFDFPTASAANGTPSVATAIKVVRETAQKVGGAAALREIVEALYG